MNADNSSGILRVVKEYLGDTGMTKLISEEDCSDILLGTIQVM